MTGDARFPAAMAAVTRVLPFGLSRVIPPNVVGYLLINLCTFSMDVGLLSLFHGVVRLPIPAAVTLSYGTAGVVSYVTNRVFNFQSRGSVGTQVPLYAAMMISNYFIFVLGLTDLLAFVGVYYLLARVIAACCEGVYLYSGMRWLVFRDALGHPREESHEEHAESVSPGGGVSGRDSGA
jgi:putative flippase GtrA